MDVHPIADLFPMLNDDELAELADDIKQRGLLQPIVLDTDGKILDGRNRHAACKIAGVKPTFTTYDGDDPEGFAVAVNVARRHLTVSQRAMVIARALRSSGSGRKRGVHEAAKAGEIKRQRISEATTVLDFAPDLADAVVAGTKMLNDAYGVAKERKQAKESEAAAVAEVRAEAPDLADEITEERLSLDNALELLEQRRAEAEVRNRVLEIDGQRNDDGAPEPTFEQRVDSGAIGWTEALTLAKQWQKERADAIRRTQGYVREVINAWKLAPSLRLNQSDRPFVRDVLAGFDDPSDLETIKRIVETLGGVA